MIVVPFRATGKSRIPDPLRHELSLAMLGDVLAATVAVASTRLVTDSDAGRELAHELGVSVVADPGRGQGAAVAAALVGVEGACLVVNSDLPAVTPADLESIAASAYRGALGIAAAADGTTNALALPYPASFGDLYGPGSAARFIARATALSLPVDRLALANLADDVDTLDDLERIGDRAGRSTRHLLTFAAR